MPDGGILALVDQPMIDDGKRDAALLRFDGSGNMMWLASFGQAGIDETGTNLALTPDGGCFVAANDWSAGFRLARLGADGQTQSCSSQMLQTLEIPSPPMTEAPFAGLPYSNVNSLWELVAVEASPNSPSVNTTCSNSCFVIGSSYGTGTAGTGAFTPQLVPNSGHCLGYTPSLDITNVVGGRRVSWSSAWGRRASRASAGPS
jgi:hypothetical protein